jgi:hypothetical protein
MLKRQQTIAILLLMCLAVGLAWIDQRTSLPSQNPVGDERSARAEHKSTNNNPLELFWDWTTREAVSFYTFVLAIFTGVLGITAIKQIKYLRLANETARIAANAAKQSAETQANDTRIIQRAYISANPRGVIPFGGGFADGMVGFENVGNLPARSVSWFIDLTLDPDVQWQGFHIKEDGFIGGTHVIPPGTEMRQWKHAEPSAEDFEGFKRKNYFVFVWGEIRYDDGFGGTRRFTKFCHRYDRRGFDDKRVSPPQISPEGAVFHQHGNEAN